MSYRFLSNFYFREKKLTTNAHPPSQADSFAQGETKGIQRYGLCTCPNYIQAWRVIQPMPSGNGEGWVVACTLQEVLTPMISIQQNKRKF
jgi:hypothetical protein